MSKTELIWYIVSFFKEYGHLRKADLGFKECLALFSDGDDVLLIEKYYQYDVTICEYKKGKAINNYQQDYDDLPINILETIYNQIKFLNGNSEELSKLVYCV